MRKGKLVTPLFLCSLIFGQSVLAANNSGLDSVRDVIKAKPISGLSEENQELVKRINGRHGGSFVRPESCPMASQNFSNILGKIESIRGLFKDPSCLEDQTEIEQTLNELTTTGQGIQQELNSAGVDTTNVSSQVPTQVSGMAINSLFNNLNTLFFKNSCELSDQNILERGADFAQNFSQIGLLIPNGNGLVVAGGGLALSGILRLINNLFTKKFDFENNSERQAFIKLNCAFYDIRRDIEKSGLVEITLPEHHEDFSQLKDLLKAIEAKRKENLANKVAIVEAISKAEKEFITKAQGPLTALENSAQKALKVVQVKVADQEDGLKPADTVKKEMLQDLLEIKETLLSDLQAYFDVDLSTSYILDLDLQNELKKLNVESGNREEFMKLFKMAPEEFNKTYRASLLFHFGRIMEDIKEMKTTIAERWKKVNQLEGQSVAEYLKALDKSVADQDKALDEVQKTLTPVNVRLERIVGADNGYTRTDDGTENKTAILASYDEIANQIYGKWGYEFLKFTTKTAEKENDRFYEKFSLFADAHLEEGQGGPQIPQASEIGKLRVMYACQDAKPYLRRFAHAESLTQQAYDFVITNKELFHSDHPTTFISDVTAIRSVFEKIQDHHKSSLYALKLMRGEDIPADKKEHYLGSKAQRKEFLGTVMLKVGRTKPQAQLLQKLMDTYDCNKLTNSDD